MLQSPAPAPSRTPPWSGQPIVLVGLMGAGKSTVGRRLALRLGLPFVDADSEIEIAAGMAVADIFERFGEAHFRDGERRVIARLMDGEKRVIATGGGAFVDPGTRAAILASGFAIWLDAKPSVVVERVWRPDTRALLRGKGPVAVRVNDGRRLKATVATAHLRVSSHRAPHDATVNTILKALGKI
uniref:shikimate kinase n=1 Tax=uncultured Sphingomonas sp. TaxID=158754 RepID=UPI0035CC7AC6